MFFYYSNIDNDITSLSCFSPELLVKTVAKCLILIKPSIVNLPMCLPHGMAQKFAATNTLAETCQVRTLKSCEQMINNYNVFSWSDFVEILDIKRFYIRMKEKYDASLCSSLNDCPRKSRKNYILSNSVYYYIQYKSVYIAFSKKV